MKFTPEVIAALAVLRNAAENDFERHRLDVLERDLTAPPVVEILDDTHQKFNGIVCNINNKTGHFFYTEPLHRLVWRYYSGNIPDKYVIHHIDCNKFNNNISNLQMLTGSEHRKIHSSILIEKKCIVCEKKIKGSNRKKFCSNHCRYKYSAKDKPKKKKLIIKTCLFCGKNFEVRPSGEMQKFCSTTCFHDYQKAKLPPKKCAWCGKEFRPYPHEYDETRCCSLSCAGHLRESQRRNGVMPKPDFTNRLSGIQNKTHTNNQSQN